MTAMNRTLGRLIDAALGNGQMPAPTAVPASVPRPPPRPSTARRRMKLWELPSRWHCPLIGTCLTPQDMRRLARQVGVDSSGMSEYELHTLVVSNCAERNDLSERAQRLLDERFSADIQRFSKARDDAAILALWRTAYDSGETAGALWAAWSHAAMSEDTGKAIYGDIHMLSHQVGAGIRTNLRQLNSLRQENARLRGELDALRNDAIKTRCDKDRLLEETQRHLIDAERRAALLGVHELELTEARKAARNYATVFERATLLTHRVEVIEERNAANARRAAQLAQELNETQDNLTAAEAALELALGIGSCEGVSGSSGCGRACPVETQFAGRCVLCIGGRANLVNGYRRLVETQGGRFLHHDGGIEESLHRIDAAVASADAVVCQSGCVSHAAYWRLKEACKKLDKPCVFLKSPGVGSFARGLAALASSDGQTIHVARLAS